MRPWLLLALLAGCYQVDLAACVVRCADESHACPAGLTCGSDDYCHPAGETGVCQPGPDGAVLVDASEQDAPILDAELVHDGLVPIDAIEIPDAPDDPCFGLCSIDQVCMAPCNCCCDPSNSLCCTQC